MYCEAKLDNAPFTFEAKSDTGFSPKSKGGGKTGLWPVESTNIHISIQIFYSMFIMISATDTITNIN